MTTIRVAKRKPISAGEAVTVGSTHGYMLPLRRSQKNLVDVRPPDYGALGTAFRTCYPDVGRIYANYANIVQSQQSLHH